MIKAKFDFEAKKITGVNIRSFVIRETNGADEMLAASIVEAKGKGAMLTEELTRLAIVEVDGAPVVQPFGAIDTWNTKTRSFVSAAYKKINLPTVEESDDFLASAVLMPE